MSDDTSQKTEEPTPHRLEQAQKKGQFAISKEISHGLMLLTFLMCVVFVFPFTFKDLTYLLKTFLLQALAFPHDAYGLCQHLISHVAWLFVVPALVIIGMAFTSGLGQTGFRISTQHLKISFEKISPVKGLKRLFSAKTLFEFFKNLFKLGLMSWTTYLIVAASVKEIIYYPTFTLQTQLHHFCLLLLKVMGSLVLMVFLLGIADYFYERWSHRRQLRMSKQEIKDEQKETEGDPHIKGRLRQLRMERAKKRLASQVPQATVIITNPTHYAVALKYTWGQTTAPVVIAKGLDFLALAIKEIAKDHRIPVVENPPLARSLYKGVKEGKEIPTHFYEAVAKIIRYVYTLKHRR